MHEKSEKNIYQGILGMHERNCDSTSVQCLTFVKSKDVIDHQFWALLNLIMSRVPRNFSAHISQYTFYLFIKEKL